MSYQRVFMALSIWAPLSMAWIVTAPRSGVSLHISSLYYIHVHLLTNDADSSTKTNAACGEDSDCINRATKIECTGDCGCGPECQNQRFQQRQYADVTVIQTEKKGYGLRADTNLRPHDFIFEYIGEVINEANFRRRTIQYNDEGIKHFYFMSLTKNEFVDATKKGNLGRFCNHSCNPNCYVDKWVVGDKLRMGIFAERKIKAGEELVFNYNVDRYGADPQPCYCGEPNCTGYIGGKTQTERATQLSLVTIEALGIDDGNGWDTAVAKRPRKKKAGEDDEEYVNNVQPKSLDVDAVTKVMATLMQCKEKWIAVKVLGRIQRCDDEKVRNRVVRMHGYRILSSTLSLWKDDFNVAQQVLDIIEKLPRLTRNKISDSGIESTVDSLKDCGNGRIEMQVAALLEEWSTLEVAYRIPRKKREMNDTATPEKLDRYSRRDSAPRERRGRSRSRSKSRSRSRSRSIDAPRGPAAPSGPRGGFPQRNPGFFGGPRPPPRPRPFLPPLPAGWHSALSNGTPYYYTATGETTWTRPIMAAAPPPPPPKPTSANPALDAIIKEIEESKERERKEKASASATPQAPTGEPSSERRKEGKDKWRSYSEEKQKKLYENTVRPTKLVYSPKPLIRMQLFPHIKYVVDKYKHKLPRDDLKKFAKQVCR
jgi:SET domain-containing protein